MKTLLGKIMNMTTENLTVTENTSAHRFEVQVEGKYVFLEYIREGKIIAFTHAETPPELRGRGLAGVVTKFALESAKAAGLKVIPQCPYVHDYILKHPEYIQLLDGK